MSVALFGGGTFRLPSAHAPETETGQFSRVPSPGTVP
jgi:hypothetical protein